MIGTKVIDFLLQFLIKTLSSNRYFQTGSLHECHFEKFKPLHLPNFQSDFNEIFSKYNFTSSSMTSAQFTQFGACFPLSDFNHVRITKKGVFSRIVIGISRPALQKQSYGLYVKNKGVYFNILFKFNTSNTLPNKSVSKIQLTM